MIAERIAFWNEWAGGWAGLLWNACWQGLLFTLTVWALCRWVGRLPLTVRPWLWWLACLKLLIGLSGLTPLTAPVLPAPSPTLLAATTPAPAPPGMETGALGMTETGETMQRSMPSVHPNALAWMCLLWLVGVGYGSIRLGHRYRVLQRMLRESRSLTDVVPGAEARRLGVDLGMPYSPRVIETPTASAPFVTGLFRPVIVLPVGFADACSLEELRMALAHELAHLRRQDLWFALIPTLTSLLFFFFPPAWIACREWATAREAACDAVALEATGASATLYGRLLLKIVARDDIGGFPATLGATASYHTLKVRLQLLKRSAVVNGRWGRWGSIALAAISLLLLIPWHITAKSGPIHPAVAAIPVPPEPADVAEVPLQDLHAENDVDKRYLLIGPSPNAPAPPEGYRVLLVLPGGDGGAEFRWFVKRLYKYSLGPRYLVIEPVAPQWSSGQFDQVVWPTETNPWQTMRFSTERFVEAALRDVAQHYPIDKRYIFTLGWASGGPPTYAISLQPSTPITGTFVAMSVFLPATLPPLDNARGRAYFLLHSPDDTVVPIKHADQARKALERQGARVEMATYAGGMGWHGDVYPLIQRGVRSLEQSVERKSR